MSRARPTRKRTRIRSEWEIPASILNTLWGTIWPRLIAHWWTTPARDFPIGLGVLTPESLLTAIHTLVKLEAAAHDPPLPEPLPPDGDGVKWTTTRFQRRAQDVVEYLRGQNCINLNFVGEGSYDFILSDVGLDLFAPERPADDWEMFRYYSFRNTGRRAVGIPDYLKGTHAFSVDAPTSPGQILTNDDGLDIAVISDQSLRDIEDRLDISEAVTEKGRRGGPFRRDLNLQFSYESFVSLTSRSRRWQVAGAVYRGIMVELPRIIAVIWSEKASGFTGSKTYTARFAPKSKGARNIFKERLETSLPPAGQMKFDVEAALPDVLVSHKGFRFPEAPEPPTLANMLQTIAQGGAGNPVFTDTDDF